MPTKPAFHEPPAQARGLSPLLVLCLALGLAWCLPRYAAAAQPMGCLIEAERLADVGSPVIGVVSRVMVERGDRVKKGQVLALLRAPVERASLSVASARADSDAELQAAMVAAKFNKEKLLRTEDLFRQQFLSQQALEQARSESTLSDQKLIQARELRVVSRQEREVASAHLTQRTILSPMDGVVAERFVSAGERVDDKPLLRIAKIDPLRVQLVVPVSLYSQVQLGSSAQVAPDLPGAAAVLAQVTMIDKVMDPASNTFRVHLSLPNPDAALPAGLRCKAVFSAGLTVPDAQPQGKPILKTAHGSSTLKFTRAINHQPKPE